MALRSIRDHKQHKIASIISGDLDKIVPTLESMIKQLTQWAHYTPVKKVVYEMNINLHLLKAHQTKYKKLEEDTRA